MATGIQIGANTHHQDHVITLHSLSTINAIVKSVGNPPIEIDILLFSLIICYILWPNFSSYCGIRES